LAVPVPATLFYDAQQLLPLAIVALLSTLACILGYKLVRDITGSLGKATNMCYQMTDRG
jgi:hypothetical protein